MKLGTVQVFGLCLFFAAICIADDAATQPSTTQPGIAATQPETDDQIIFDDAAGALTADSLRQAYLDNVIRAERDYKDKLMGLRGTINKILDENGHPILLLGKKDDPAVACIFDDDQEPRDRISSLNVGDEVFVMGSASDLVERQGSRMVQFDAITVNKVPAKR